MSIQQVALSTLIDISIDAICRDDNVHELKLLYKKSLGKRKDEHFVFIQSVYHQIADYSSVQCFKYLTNECTNLMFKTDHKSEVLEDTSFLKMFEEDCIKRCWRRSKDCIRLLNECTDIPSLAFLFTIPTKIGWARQREVLLWLLSFPDLLNCNKWLYLAIALISNCDEELRKAFDLIALENTTDYNSILSASFHEWDNLYISDFYRDYCRNYYTNREYNKLCISNLNILVLMSYCY